MDLHILDGGKEVADERDVGGFELLQPKVVADLQILPERVDVARARSYKHSTLASALALKETAMVHN